jgi:predicted transcriptional regulator
MYRETSNIVFPEVVEVLHTGLPGRPRKDVSADVLQEAMRPGRKIKISHLAAKLHIDRKTLRNNLKRQGIDYGFTEITDDELDALVREYQSAHPDSGYSYVYAFIRRHNVRIPKERLEEAINRVDPVNTILRNRKNTGRKVYKIPRPNALWHGDGHHKLIRWGIVIHAFIDGYCRTVGECSLLQVLVN